MSEIEIFHRFAEVIRDTFDEDQLEVTPQLTSDDVEAWNSLGTIRLLSAVEDEFGVQFSVEEIFSLNDVDGWVKLIQARSI